MDAGDAAAEALAWAWEEWDKVQTMENPAGYLFRVGRSKSRLRKAPRLAPVAALDLPDVEPRLVPALLGLPSRQRTAVWLVHACQWRPAEVAEAMGVSPSAVSTHLSRGLHQLRAVLEVTDRA